jgi:hypothetical protein
VNPNKHGPWKALNRHSTIGEAAFEQAENFVGNLAGARMQSEQDVR